MKNPTTPPDLDAALREGAQARRALLDRQTYPVGDYPSRRATSRPAQRGLHAVLRGAWMLGLSGGITAVLLLGLAGVLQLMPTVEDGPAVADAPQTQDLADSISTLIAQFDQAEQSLARELDTSFRVATTWPGRVQTLGESLVQPTELPAPMGQEIAAIQHDLLAAADYVRQQWRTASPQNTPPNSPESRFWPVLPVDLTLPANTPPAPFDPAHGVVSG